MHSNSSRKLSEGDTQHVLDQQSRKIHELEQFVERLRNALVSLEEDNLTLNKKLKENQALLCHNCRSASQHPSPNDRTYQDRFTQLEKEKLALEMDLKLIESKKKGFKAELESVTKGCEEFKTAKTESLDWKNMQVVKENEKLVKKMVQMQQSSQQSVKVDKGDKLCKLDHLEKQQLTVRLVLLQEEVSRLTEELRKAQQMRLADLSVENRRPVVQDDGQDQDMVAQLKQENKVLRESLEQSCLVAKKAQSRAESARQQKMELERCLLTLQTEKNLLQAEVRKLHQEYISLSNSVSLQLRDTINTGSFMVEPAFQQHQADNKGFLVTQGSPQRSMHHSAPEKATVDRLVGKTSCIAGRSSFSPERP